MSGVLVIVGPTAVGKTEIAIELASVVGGEIVSADSMAVYMGMNIGTAKPTDGERVKASFHLIDVADPGKPFSVGEYQRLAHAAMDDILCRDRTVIVVGGSGLYVRAAVDGLDESVPPENPELRRELYELARENGNEYVHARLAAVDPVSAERIHANNTKRVVRAIEIYETIGAAASALFEEDSKRGRCYPDARFFCLTMGRDALYERIEKRVDAMIEAGLVDEVARLLDKGIDPNLPSMQGLGYKEIAGYLAGGCSREEAVDLLKKNTRRFAKRQYTWFRADARVKWIDVEDRAATQISETIRKLYRDTLVPIQK
jgi:tRNA dimethylallyltransferase